MLGWLRDKIYKRISSESRQSVRSSNNMHSTTNSDSINLGPSTAPLTMQSENADRVTLHIIYEYEMWEVAIDRHKVISDLLTMAVGHFLDLTNQEEPVLKFKFISVSQKKVLNLQVTIGDEGLQNYDEILLVEKILMVSSEPAKLTIQDIKGPTIQEIFAATANVPRKNKIQMVPSLECQESFQSDIRKVLYSLVEASAKIIAQDPDAKVIFSGIAARIDAKYKKELDKNAIKFLIDLGFTEAQAKFALRLKRNRQVEAMEWLLENSHLVRDVPDMEESRSDSEVETDVPLKIIERLLDKIYNFHQRHFEPNSRALENLTAMGFDRDDVVEALRLSHNSQVDACEWLCGERGENVTNPRLDPDRPLYKALMSNAAIQLGLSNPKILLAFLSILDNPASANLWLNDVDTAPVLGQVFKTYHSENHMIIVNQQLKLMRQQADTT